MYTCTFLKVIHILLTDEFTVVVNRVSSTNLYKQSNICNDVSDG